MITGLPPSAHKWSVKSFFFVDVISFDCSLDVFLVNWLTSNGYLFTWHDAVKQNRRDSLPSWKYTQTENRQPPKIYSGGIFICLPTHSHHFIRAYLNFSCLSALLFWANSEAPCLSVDNGWNRGRLPWFQLRLPCWLEVEEWHLSARCGREGVDGARNWFPAAARLQLQHQQHSGRHQIPTLPLDLWLTTIVESSSFNPKVIVALSSALGMLCRPAELQLLLGKAGKLMRLRSPVLVRRGT